MAVDIGDVKVTANVVDGDSPSLERIVRAVLSALDERQLHERRWKADTSVTAGIASEQERA
jgi:hypothetical protein